MKRYLLLCISVFIALAILLVVHLTITELGRVGKTKVNITVVPSASTIEVDGKKISGHVVYVSKGKHRFTALYRDFTPDQKTLTVEQPIGFTLVPSPDSASAITFLQDNPKIQQERESLAGSVFASNSRALSQNYPFLSQLPVIVRGFEIYQADPVRSQDKQGKIALDIVTDNPLGRQRSIEFIRTKLNVDPSTIEIDFRGMNNVFSSQRGD